MRGAHLEPAPEDRARCLAAAAARHRARARVQARRCLSARIVQAPMANNQPPSLAAVVSNAGALGMVPCAYQSADAVRSFVHEVRALTDRPFGLNFFAPPYLDEDALAAAIEESPAVLSFHGGVSDVTRLHDAGIEVFATATTADEAHALADAG